VPFREVARLPTSTDQLSVTSGGFPELAIWLDVLVQSVQELLACASIQGNSCMLSQNAVGLPDNDGCCESAYALTPQRRSLLNATLEIAIKTEIKLGYCGGHLQPPDDGLRE